VLFLEGGGQALHVRLTIQEHPGGLGQHQEMGHRGTGVHPAVLNRDGGLGQPPGAEGADETGQDEPRVTRRTMAPYFRSLEIRSWTSF
jgi:hypothetical protein